MSTTAPTKSSLDVAVESACQMFLSMRNLVKVKLDSITRMNGTRGVDGLREQLDLLEEITDATLRTIQDLRSPRVRKFIDDAVELSYCKYFIIYAHCCGINIFDMRRFVCQGREDAG